MFRKKKDYKTAVKELDRIIALDDNNENAFHERGSIAALEDRNEDALKDLSRAIEINDCGGAHYDRALVYKDKKQMPEALQDLNAAIQSDPKDEQAFHVRGRVQLSLKNYQAAVSDFDRAAQLDPTCTSVGRDRAKAEELLESAN